MATSKSISLVVLGSHGHTNIADIILGAIAEKVIHRSMFPVLVVSGETTVHD